MRFSDKEIIEDIQTHMRKFGGEPGEWRVGTAEDARAPFFRRHQVADLGDKLIYREAYTASVAEEVVDHLVNACGLHPDRDSVPEPGKIVFVYRPAAPDHVAASPPQTCPN